MTLRNYDMIRATLTCPICGKKATAVLMVNRQGMIKVTKYLCSNDFGEMVMEVNSENNKQGGNSG